MQGLQYRPEEEQIERERGRRRGGAGREEEKGKKGRESFCDQASEQRDPLALSHPQGVGRAAAPQERDSVSCRFSI